MQESCHSPVIRGMTGFLLESYPSFFRNLFLFLFFSNLYFHILILCPNFGEKLFFNLTHSYEESFINLLRKCIFQFTGSL